MNGSSRPDEVLLSAARAGDGEAFGEFYKRRRALLLGYLRPRVPDAETAVDLMAESFAAALLAIRDPGRPIPEEPVAWLLTITRNKLIDSIRRGRVEQAARDRLALEPLEIDDEDILRIEDAAASVDLAATRLATFNILGYPPMCTVRMPFNRIGDSDEIAANTGLTETSRQSGLVRPRSGRAVCGFL